MSSAVAAESSQTSSSSHCPACGKAATDSSRAWRLVNARGEAEWLQCNECCSYFMDREYALHSEVSHTQQMTWGDADEGAALNQFKRRMYRSVIGTLQKHLGDVHGKRMLDIGCAYGGFMAAADEAGLEVEGYDIVPEAVEHVRSQGLRAECCASVTEFSLSKEPFDVVTVLDANIYWPDQPGELQEIFQRIRPGGFLVMRVVDKSWLARIGGLLQSVSPQRGNQVLRRALNDHRFSMPLGSFLRVVKQTGFDVISATPRGAVHSDQTSLAVKLSFGLGAALWHSLGIFMAPGAVVVARRPAQ